MRKLVITFNQEMIPELYRLVQIWGREGSCTFDYIRNGIEREFPEIAERCKMDKCEATSLRQFSDFTQGARIAVSKFIDEYVGVRTEKRNKPYVKAEHDFILANKDNMWQWLSSRAGFHYRNHKKDKNGNLVSCEAYLP